MAWLNATLGDLFPASLAEAQAIVAETEDRLDKLTPVKSIVDGLVAAAQAEVDIAEALLADLGATGYRCISLAPGDTAWNARLYGAENAPSTNPALYSAVVASIIIAADPSGVLDAYNDMKNSLKTAVKKPSLATPTPAAPNLVPESALDWMEEDEWVGQSLKDMFPAAYMSAESKVNFARAALQAAQNKKQSVDGAISGLESALIAAQGVITKLAGTGVYNLVLPPATGGWLTRMQSEPGSPPTSGVYCAGIAVVVVAADLSSCQAMYDKIAGIL